MNRAAFDDWLLESYWLHFIEKRDLLRYPDKETKLIYYHLLFGAVYGSEL